MRLTFGILMSLLIGAAHANTNLTAAIENVRAACGGISDELSDMKKMAGITTAVTAVGTAAGSVALGTGIAKSVTDKEIQDLEKQLKELEEQQKEENPKFTTISDAATKEAFTTIAKRFTTQQKQQKQAIDTLNEKSKKLGDVRTGTIATSAATNIAGAVMSGTNQVKDNLKSKIDACLASVKELSNARMQARLDQSASETELDIASNIIHACNVWATVDIEPINNRSTGATISSSIGAATGLAGTITSASANSKTLRDATETEAQNKEKNLNTAANVLAGTTTAASVAATIFNATQISAIKRAAAAADECEGALK